jgi:hypothetical protein
LRGLGQRPKVLILRAFVIFVREYEIYRRMKDG